MLIVSGEIKNRSGWQLPLLRGKLLSGIRAFSIFIPEEVVTRIIYGDPRSVRPHVDTRNVTIMFTGIRGIMQMSLNEEQMLSVITRFHKMMTSIVEQYEGTVGNLAVEKWLVVAGLAQRQAMNTLRQELVDDGWLDPSDAFLRLGVGIHSGSVLVGCIGSAMKMKFGCIGDAMNLTSRLQGLCKFYDVDVMCSEETCLATSALVCRKLDLLQVKGRQETTAVYEILGQDTVVTMTGTEATQATQATQATSASGMAGPISTDSSSPKSEPGPDHQAEVQAQTIGNGALTLPIPKSNARKKGPPQFLPPEEERSDAPMLLNPMSRSPMRRNWPDASCQYLCESPVVIGRADSPGHTTPGERTSVGDRTNRTYGGGATSTAASASHMSHYPSPSPGSGSEGCKYHPTSRGYPSSSMSPAAGFLDQVTTDQKAFAAEYEAAFDAYTNSRFDECVEICRQLLKWKPFDTSTQLLLERALHRGTPINVHHEKTKFPHEDWTFRKFLSRYNKSVLYSTATTPQTLAHEVYLLPVMNCGGYSKKLAATVMWMSSGSTKSVIHQDGQDHWTLSFRHPELANCSEFIQIYPATLRTTAGEAELLQWQGQIEVEAIRSQGLDSLGVLRTPEEEDLGQPMYGQYAGKVDVDNVDLDSFPGWDSLRWWNMTMAAGDCAFIPRQWFHFVQSPPVRSISIHVWFHGEKFDPRGCEALKAKGFDTSEFDTDPNHNLVRLLSWQVDVDWRAALECLGRIGDCTFGYEQGKKGSGRETDSKEHMARLAVGSLKEAGKRGIIVGGWAELSEESLGGADAEDLKEYSRNNILFLKSAPHEWLFPQCACCVHHGGIGTAQASLSAGVPTVVTPVFADQKDIAKKLSRDGHGEGTVHLSQLSAKELGAKIKRCCEDPKILENCKKLAEVMQKEDGTKTAIEFIEKFKKEVDDGAWKKKRDALEQRLKVAHNKFKKLLEPSQMFAKWSMDLAEKYPPMKAYTSDQIDKYGKMVDIFMKKKLWYVKSSGGCLARKGEALKSDECGRFKEFAVLEEIGANKTGSRLHVKRLKGIGGGAQSDALDFLESEDALPSNVIVRTFVPQVEMLNDYASCFLSHVGFNSLQESLMAGVPLVAVPQAVDQPANAMKVQKMSWGVSFLHPMATVNGPALAAAFEDVLRTRNRRFRAAVEAAQQDLAGGVLPGPTLPWHSAQ
eukprot:s98_g4.t1